jgi:hypothetical protein
MQRREHYMKPAVFYVAIFKFKLLLVKFEKDMDN